MFTSLLMVLFGPFLSFLVILACFLCVFWLTFLVTQFGTPEQVAARVVTAELNRDGVFEVTLLEDPYESSDGGYVLEYLSNTKRGNKHFVSKIFIQSQMLYVLTVQSNEQDFVRLKQDVDRSVKSFSV